MPSEFEAGLLPVLKHLVPDLEAEHPIEGKGKGWVVNLYSAHEDLVIEACSRNVVRTGKSRTSIQHYEKFYSMLLKLIDIKTKHPKVRPVMIWRSLIPAHSTDLRLCTNWGIYVMSNESLDLSRVLAGESPNFVNKRALNHLIRRNDTYKPRWRWLVEERRKSIVELLKAHPMGHIEIEKALGFEHKPRQSRVSQMLRELTLEGAIKRLTPGYVRGYGAIYGIDSKQLDEFEATHFAEYRNSKRKKRIADRVLQALREDGPMDYRQIQTSLQKRWGIDATRETVVGILARRLRHDGLVRAEGPPKGLVYSVVPSQTSHALG